MAVFAHEEEKQFTGGVMNHLIGARAKIPDLNDAENFGMHSNVAFNILIFLAWGPVDRMNQRAALVVPETVETAQRRKKQPLPWRSLLRRRVKSTR